MMMVVSMKTSRSTEMDVLCIPTLANKYMYFVVDDDDDNGKACYVRARYSMLFYERGLA